MKLTKLFTTILFIITICASASWGLFYVSEYVSGKEYVEYLQNNKESKTLSEPFEFDLIKGDISRHSLILVGEIHGFHAPTEFDVEFFTHLRKHFNVETYLLEMDFSQAYFMNKYNQTGDETILERVLQNWVVGIGQDNSSYKKRWQKLQNLYQTGATFQYLGNDKLRDIALLYAHINELDEQLLYGVDTEKSEKELLQFALEAINNRLAMDISESLSRQLTHIKRNIEHKIEDTHREEVLTTNLLDLYELYGLFDKQVYGFYGLGHTLLNPIAEGHNPMASRLTEHDTWFSDNTLAINMVFVDSDMTVRSNTLPSFIQDEGTYSKLSVSYDSLLTYYAYGIMDLKQTTSRGTKTLFKLNNTDSPYQRSQRLFNAFKLLPMGQTITAREDSVTTDYGQYLLFIRDSDWAIP
ncbi:hypothetical protein [Thalassotalea mangrovi]|uniref:Erythromycin esterase family protein n=1 Tax=Thalassotalea mangrovi TaxID=2572245 RepID=A0A4U1B2V1_9GAMM|nr:hypothetical protein [Thalassotalea mangrovi]TKB43979.1 hypothetical protein E8M12_13475 [Thalassotalea mangrovi]